MTKSKSLAREYIAKKEDKELMSLEKLLQRRRNTLENWVSENNVNNIIQAEEKAKILGVMITLDCLTKLETLFAASVTPTVESDSHDDSLIAAKKKKKHSSFTDLLNESTVTNKEEN